MTSRNFVSRVMLTASTTILGCIVAAILNACVPGLRDQQSLASISHGARASCAADKRTCSRAVVCIRGVLAAEEATQQSVEARAKGQPDDELDVQAVALVAGARAICSAACFDSAGRNTGGCSVKHIVTPATDLGTHDLNPPRDSAADLNRRFDGGIKDSR